MRVAAERAALRGDAQASSCCFRPVCAELCFPPTRAAHGPNFPAAAALPGADAGGRAPLPKPEAASGGRGPERGRGYED